MICFSRPSLSRELCKLVRQAGLALSMAAWSLLGADSIEALLADGARRLAAGEFEAALAVFSAAASQQPLSAGPKKTIIFDPKSLVPVKLLPNSVMPEGSAVTVPIIGYKLPEKPQASTIALQFKKDGSLPAHPSGAVITPDPVITKQPTAEQKAMLDKGIDQFWDAFQLTGKEAKIL